MINVFKRMGARGLVLTLFTVLFTALEVHFDLKIPDKMSELTMYVQMGNDDMGKILRTGGEMLIYTFAGISAVLISSFLVAKITSDLSATIRKDFYYKCQDMSMNEMNKFSIPSLITRATNDIVNIELAMILGMIVLFKAPIMAGMAIRKIRNQNHDWSMLTGIAIVFILVICIAGLIMIYKKFISLQKLTDDVNSVARENYNGTYTIRSFNYEDKRAEEFEARNLKLTKTEQFTDTVVIVINTIVTVVMNVLTVLIYLLGASAINDAYGEEKLVLFSNMLVFSTYAIQIITSLVMMIVVFIFLPKAIVSANRISEVLDSENTVVDGNKRIESIDTIEFRNVDFRYPGTKDNALSSINFKLKRGETLAITGSTGCGKTTLINALMRFYDAAGGEILINGESIKNYVTDDLYRRIGYVPQKGFLFKGTIGTNIAYGCEKAEKSKFENVCRISAVDGFLGDLPDGIDSRVLHRGDNFSGGQKQRMSIARAIYKEPDVMVFDDSFSAVDYKTDKTIRNNLKNEYNDKIKIIVSQRTSTIVDADKILVLDDGIIVGSGTHEELMESCEQYKKFADIQMKRGEDIE